MTDPLATLDATAQAALVARGELTPRELVEAAIARVEALDPQLNAVIIRTFERALDRAKGLEAGGRGGAGARYHARSPAGYRVGVSAVWRGVPGPREEVRKRDVRSDARLADPSALSSVYRAIF